MDERATALFFELFSGLPRQGPGDTGSTLRALALVPGVGAGSRILDVGCATGRQTLVLGRATGGTVVAVDNHPPFVEALNREALAAGFAGRVEARVGDMRALDFAPGAFSLLWSEGAIYAMGFAAGLRAWHPLLAPGGHVAVTEACWFRPDPPPECAAFWREEYPAIRDVADRLGVIEACGCLRLPLAAPRGGGRGGAGRPGGPRDRRLAPILRLVRLRVLRHAVTLSARARRIHRVLLDRSLDWPHVCGRHSRAGAKEDGGADEAKGGVRGQHDEPEDLRRDRGRVGPRPGRGPSRSRGDGAPSQAAGRPGLRVRPGRPRRPAAHAGDAGSDARAPERHLGVGRGRLRDGARRGLAHGRLFCAATMDMLDVVRGVVAAYPGAIRWKGPHGISLLRHAEAGEAKQVVDYLTARGARTAS